MFKSKYDIFSVFVCDNSPINSNDILLRRKRGLHNFNKWKLHKYDNILIFNRRIAKYNINKIDKESFFEYHDVHVLISVWAW